VPKLSKENRVADIHGLDEKASKFIRDKPIFSSERMLHKDYYRKSCVGKKSLVVSLKGPGSKTN
jgi:hypothetical protein